jgi:hypothetical protein
MNKPSPYPMKRTPALPGLTTRDGEASTRFQVAGGDRNFVEAEAVIEGESLLIGSPNVANPVAVRFAWSEDSRPNLMNPEGLSAPSARINGQSRSPRAHDARERRRILRS